MTQSARFIGRHFQGVVSSRGLSPDASQDVAKVFAERARIVVADGAGDTGAAAGEWAGVLALCYGSSEGTGSSAEPEWLGRAVEAWNRASNLSRFTTSGAGVNQQELALLQRGVDASFIGAAFEDRGGALFVKLAAAGDCEAFLFRGGKLYNHGPIIHWRDFTSTAGSLNSKDPRPGNLVFVEWELMEADVLIVCSDALGQFILRACEDAVPNEVRLLMQCTEWQDLRQNVEAWRQDGRLRNDDVAIVRVCINRAQGVGRFSLAQDSARRATSLPVSGDEALAGKVVMAAPLASDTPKPIEPPNIAAGSGKVNRLVLYRLLGAFALGLLMGAMLPLQRTWTRQRSIKTASTDSTLTTGELAEPMQRASGTVNPQQATNNAPSTGENGERREDKSSTIARDAGKNEEKVAKGIPVPVTRQHELSDKADRGASLIQKEESPKGNPAKVDLAAPVAAPSIETFPASSQVRATPQAENSATVVTGDLTTELEHRDSAPTEKTTAEADTQPKAPCALLKGDELYGTAKVETWPLLRIESSHAICVVVENAGEDTRRVKISAWVNAGPAGGVEPAWLREGQIPRPTNVRTAPRGELASEPLGNVREGTPFTLVRRMVRGRRLWVEITITAYHFVKRSLV